MWKDGLRIVQRDPGKRGIAPLVSGIDMMKECAGAVQAIKQYDRIGICTGFPCVPRPIPTESDGLGGSHTLAETILQYYPRKHVVVVSDEANVQGIDPVFTGLKGAYPDRFNVRYFPARDAEAVRRFQREIELVIYIERVGPNERGGYCTMRGKDLGPSLAPLELLSEGIPSIGVGDGGNEVGMGRVKELVKQHIPLGGDIACDISTTYLLICGIADWGGYILSRGLIPLGEEGSSPLAEERVKERAERMVEIGICDGVLGEAGLTVDGVALAETLAVVRGLRMIE